MPPLTSSSTHDALVVDQLDTASISGDPPAAMPTVADPLESILGPGGELLVDPLGMGKELTMARASVSQFLSAPYSLPVDPPSLQYSGNQVPRVDSDSTSGPVPSSKALPREDGEPVHGGSLGHRYKPSHGQAAAAPRWSQPAAHSDDLASVLHVLHPGAADPDALRGPQHATAACSPPHDASSPSLAAASAATPPTWVRLDDGALVVHAADGTMTFYGIGGESAAPPPAAVSEAARRMLQSGGSTSSAEGEDTSLGSRVSRAMSSIEDEMWALSMQAREGGRWGAWSSCPCQRQLSQECGS
jgi:hypothetical protein